MNKTPEEKLEILISKLKRLNKLDKSRQGTGIKHNLSNVRCFPFWIEVYLESGMTLELDGVSIKLDSHEVYLNEIIKIFWITPDDNNLLKRKRKISNFDYMYLQTDDIIFPIEGMGQSVFPVMSWIKWAISNC